MQYPPGLQEALHEIDVPTSVLVTEQDQVIEPEHQYEIARQIKTSKLFRFDGGHACCTNPDYGEALANACLDVTKRLKSRGKNRAVAPSDRINMAFIGAGNQAGNDVRDFIKDERLHITTICDVNKESSGYWSGKVAGRDFITRQVDDFASALLNHGR